MDKRLTMGWLFTLILIIFLICTLSNTCNADTYYDTMIAYFAKRIDSLEKTIEVMREEQYRQGMEFAEMRGEMRGRQNATTATAAGVPTGLAGLLAWWMRREKRKK